MECQSETFITSRKVVNVVTRNKKKYNVIYTCGTELFSMYTCKSGPTG